ncbi:hypothetical protein MTO96_043561 [Rhipicephalus appendiculatus]
MAKKFPSLKSEETSGGKSKQEKGQEESSRDRNGEPMPNQNVQRCVPISEDSGYRSRPLPAYAVRDCNGLNISHLPTFPKVAAIPYTPATSGTVSDPRCQSNRSELGNQAGAGATQLSDQGPQDNLAESSPGVVDETLRMLQSMKMSAESAVTAAPCVPPRSQTWIPVNLSQRVSRVYYYSRGYSEEVSSGPLEVSGYTMRLSLICEMKSKDVVLSFHGRFCARTANENVTWPFRGELELSIHHPMDATGNRVYRLRPTQGQATIMPRLVDNGPMRLAGPIKVSALDEAGLWAVGTLHLSIKILL